MKLSKAKIISVTSAVSLVAFTPLAFADNTGYPAPPSNGTSTPGGFTQVVVSQNFSATGGEISTSIGSSKLNVQVPTGAFDTTATVQVTKPDVSSLISALPGIGLAGYGAVSGLGLSFTDSFGKDITPSQPVKVTFSDSRIQPGDIIVKIGTDGNWTIIPSTVTNGSATITLLSDPNFAILSPSFHVVNDSIGVRGYSSSVPGFVAQGTTYMGLWYLMKELNEDGIKSTWNGSVWNIEEPSHPSTLTVGHGNVSISVNGVATKRVDGSYAIDPSSGKRTEYIPVWYAMEVLNGLGIHSNWDGHSLKFTN